ncbi:DUF5368 family protein [Halomonas sp. MCCC 1A17488]|uniref:DUF5368 family protein n=1 Tax=Billgrantia sulfidoxydans TaxID=2733484 RepID=A0ABX7W8C3_9GAMM|nr:MULTISPECIES: DUF5368 family protein [Halomonas]MCE8017621.1 DUF5368 family protein [Halomonas sp. MCCC 1A17488]MCG3240954.1 DUF5368 family protein [Halomonas sp. MCCC 1A17488]QPP48824.1 DUF5368 family protein [Halomonas sp. SS10-MC5]QTP56156.1 DUF5368 family protein [Halomonas sulfidoxydans]
MTMTGILTILMYALAPFLWLIVTSVVLLLTVQLLAHLRGYRILGYRCLGANLAAIAVGLTGLWWIPLFTHSRLAYVASVFDWIALIGALFATAILAWLVLHPLSFLLRGKSASSA